MSEATELPHACGGELAVFEMLGQSYLSEAGAVIGRIAATQAAAIQKAADVIACSLAPGIQRQLRWSHTTAQEA